MSGDIPLTSDQKAMFNELGLERDKANPEDTQQLIAILTQYLHYPSDRLAEIHREASRLGTFDEASQRRSMKESFKKTGANFSICECCCCLQQGKLPFSVEIQEISTISESIVLFFSDMKYTVAWCFMSFLLFSVFAISTNILSYNHYPEPDIQRCLRSRCVFILISLGSKLSFNETEKAHIMYVWQTWLRMALVGFWIVFFVLKSKKQKSILIQKEIQNITASDFAILINDLPISYNKQTLQEKLDAYANAYSYKFQGRFLQKGDQYDMKLTIVDFNQAEPYYQIINARESHKKSQSHQYLEKRKQYLKEWICFRQNNREFPVSEEEREIIYCEIQAKCLEMEDQIVELEMVAHQTMKEKEVQNNSRPVIVTFHHNYAKINMLNLNYLPWYANFFKSCRDVPYTLNIPGISIEPAPEPEDLIWENIGVPFKVNLFRSFATYFVTFLILAFSCVGLYILSIFQSYSDSWQVSIMISVFISGINLVLIQIIYQLSWYQKNRTGTDFEISVAHKAIIAQLINSVILNIFINLMTKKLFAKGGLAQDVLFLSVTSSFLPPITRAIAFGDAWRWLRKKWYGFARNKLDFQSQREYNLIWQKAQYQIGYNYVYTIKTILFTSFFLSLQPIIALISCIGVIMMYYSQKYVLFYRSIKPKPRSISINSKMASIMRLSIVSFACGNLLFSHIIPETHQTQKDTILDLISLALGIIIYLIPLTIILQKLQQIPTSLGLTYESEKLFLTSEYERMNPLTKDVGIRNFGEYLNNLRKKHQKDFPQIISQILDLNKDNPAQTIFKMKVGLKSHKSRYPNRNRKNSLSYIESQAKSIIKEESSAMDIDIKKQTTPCISLRSDNKIEAPLSEAVQMSRMGDKSEFLDNSFLNDCIKPPVEIVEPKPQFNFFSFIQKIIQQEDPDEPILRKEFSLPIKSGRSFSKFAQKHKESMD